MKTFSFYQKALQIRLSVICICASIFFANTTKAQVGNVIWEDNFNSLNTNIWQPDIGDGCDIGLCGWGNQELQSYQSDNVYIADVPGEPGNKALVLEARQENAGSRAFTSGKVTTDKRLSIHYGLVEVRVRVPNLQQGLWPAAWLLGTANITWPGKGEIDMMEMGFSQAARDQQQEPTSTVNNYVGANAFFSTPDGGVGNIAYDVDYNQPYVASSPMNDRFVTYRIYWEPTQLRFTVVDNGSEYDLYTNPLPIDPDGVTSAFSKPFYMLLNLAVGGTLPGVTSNGGITAPLPGKMYVDYVRVSEWNGHGSVEFNYGQLTPENGRFGVFTDDTSINNQLNLGIDGEVYAWGGTVQEGNIPPYEGNNVIAWNTVNANSWFGGGVVSLNGKDMSNYVENGSLKFRIKIPADVSFRIGITDNFTNEEYIEFPAGQTKYGLVRNGEWGQVEIPLEDYTGLLAFQNINYLFTIVSVDGALPSNTFQFAIDDIVWDDGNATTPVVNSITVSPSNNSITDGGSLQFNASALDQFGNPINTSFNWSASSGSITSNGLFTANGDGNITITASSNGINGTTSISVLPLPTGTAIPALIEAEDYNEGGEGVGYHDLTAGNTGGAYRNEDVDIENTGDASGAYNVGWIDATEWLEYTIYAMANTDLYDFAFRVASPNGNGRFHMELDGTDVTGTLVVPNTGSWQNYVDVTAEDINVTQGTHSIRLVFEASGLNINYFESVEASVPSTGSCTQTAANGDYSVQISTDSSNPTLTFIPERSGVGSPTAILYYSTNPNATFPGYMVTPNTPFSINVSQGETVYLYYTYSVPEGGERNTSNDRQSFVVGNCGNNSSRMVLSSDDVVRQSIKVYPNPIKSKLVVNFTKLDSYHSLSIYDVHGKMVDSFNVDGMPSLTIDTNEYPKGFYFIDVKGPAGHEVVKVVK